MTRLVSVAPLVTLRRLFAVLTLCSTIRFIGYGWVDMQILKPNWLFPFDGFEWLPRPNVAGAILLFSGMIFGSCLMFFDRVARIGAFMFFICFTYVDNYAHGLIIAERALVRRPPTRPTPGRVASCHSVPA